MCDSSPQFFIRGTVAASTKIPRCSPLDSNISVFLPLGLNLSNVIPMVFPSHPSISGHFIGCRDHVASLSHRSKCPSEGSISVVQRERGRAIFVLPAHGAAGDHPSSYGRLCQASELNPQCRLVITAQFGKWNYRELAQLKPDQVDDFLRHYEQCIRRAQTEGAANNNAGVVFICDWDGFSLGNYASSHALKLALKAFTSITRLNDAIRYGYQINTVRMRWFRLAREHFPPANFAAETFVNIARPFFGSLLEKFEVYGGQHETWRPALLRKIPSSQLPPEYGGDKDWKPVPWNKEKLNE